MSFAALLLVAMGVSADAFAVAVGKGLAMRRLHTPTATAVALAFGAAQAVMFLGGWLLGAQLETYVTSVDHWIAFALLLLVGGAMLYEARSGSPEHAAADDATDGGTGGLATRTRVAPKELLVLSVATSIDALAVGISSALLDVDIVAAVLVIGVVTCVLSFAGVALGQRAGARFRGPAEVAGGLVLVAIGTRILLQHLGVV
jgi:putative Mn2+ efflux pump MntP